jgi:hypothetical protein
VLITIPLKPNLLLHQALEGFAPEIHVLGDCKRPGLIIEAIADGFVTGKAV